MFLNGEVLQEY